MSDVWNDAADATTGPKLYFGQLLTSAEYVHIKKGDRKVPFDPTMHSEDTRYVEVKIGSIITTNNGNTFDLNENYLCPKKGSSLGKEWEKIVNSSLKKLGIHPRKLEDAWACWKMVPTGETWQNDKNETKQETAHSFIEFYPDEETCRAAEGKFYNRAPVEPEPDLDNTMPMPPTQAEEDKKRADYVGFLEMFWKEAGNDPQVFYDKIAGNDTLKNIFDSNSPEVVEIVGEAA